MTSEEPAPVAAEGSTNDAAPRERDLPAWNAADRGETRRRPPARALVGAMAGLFAAAVTAGAIVGFGRGDGGAMRLFITIGRLVLDDPVVSGRAEGAAVAIVGLLVHVAQVTALGALLGLVAAHARGAKLAALSVAAAVLAAGVHLTLAPAVLRLGNAVTVFPLQRLQLVALYLLLAVGLGGGMRVALLCLRLDERSS